MNRKTLFTLLAAMIFFGPGQAGGAQWPSTVAVVSPGPGTAVHSLLSLIGKVVVKYTPIDQWEVQPLGGPEVWLPLLKEGKCHFASHILPDMINAYQGRGVYEKIGATPVRTVAAGHSTPFMFWTTPDRQINTLSDLKGKRVFVRYKTNILFIEMAETQLASAGLGLSDLKSVLPFSNLSLAVKALAEDVADAILFPLVREGIEEINRLKGECQIIPLTLEQSLYIAGRLRGYHVKDLAAGDPRFGNRSPVPNAVWYRNAMFSSSILDPEVVYGVVKAVFDHSPELGDAHPLAPFWALHYRPVALAVPYHEGAIRYFREKGLWSPEARIYQERLLPRQRKN
jgi:uncharacterized protein